MIGQVFSLKPSIIGIRFLIALVNFTPNASIRGSTFFRMFSAPLAKLSNTVLSPDATVSIGSKYPTSSNRAPPTFNMVDIKLVGINARNTFPSPVTIS